MWRDIRFLPFNKNIYFKHFHLSNRFCETEKSRIVPKEPLSENDVFNEEFINRNPRNLEQMFLARKPTGYGLEMIDNSYWHKVQLIKSNRYITANVVHNTGVIVLTASTKEWGISKQLYSNTDICAVENIGKVLAQRCLQSGILFVHCDFNKEELASNRISVFLKAMEEGGVTLKEPEQIKPRQHPDL